MSAGLVSAIIPTFNRADLVCRAIDSALNQSYSDVEVIVIDDGSTDNTRELVTARYAEDARVRYIRIDNSGVSHARNVGIRASRGAYVGFLDSDDYWLPWKIELQVKCLARAPQAGMIWTDMTAISDGTSVKQYAYLRTMYSAYSQLEDEGIPVFGPAMVLPAHELQIEGLSGDLRLFSGEIFSQMILGNLVHTSTCLLRRERLERVGGFREDLRVTGEDYDFHLRTCREGPVAFVDVESIGYTIGRSDQLTSPALILHMAQNSLKTVEPVLADSGSQVKLPRGAVDRMLAMTHRWIAMCLIEVGRAGEARPHAWKSVGLDPLSVGSYKVAALSLLPTEAIAALRTIYRMGKKLLRR